MVLIGRRQLKFDRILLWLNVRRDQSCLYRVCLESRALPWKHKTYDWLKKARHKPGCVKFNGIVIGFIFSSRCKGMSKRTRICCVNFHQANILYSNTFIYLRNDSKTIAMSGLDFKAVHGEDFVSKLASRTY